MAQQEPTNSGQNNYLLWVKRSLFKLWRFHHNLIVSLLVFVAVLMLSMHGLALYLESNHKLIEKFIEQQLEQSVSFDKVHININLLYPSVSLENFVIQYKDENESRLNFNSAAITINVAQSILNTQLMIDTLALDGFYALLQRNKNGEFIISGLSLGNQSSAGNGTVTAEPAYLKLLNQTDFVVTNSEIFFVDETREIPDVFLSDVNIKMRNNNERHQITVKSSMNQTDVKAEIRLDFEGNIQDIKQWHGQVYTNLKGLNHPTLLHLISEDVIQLENYELDDIDMGLRSWAEIVQGKLQRVRGELYVDNAQVKRLDTKEQVYFNRIESNFQLQRHNEVKTDWVLDLFDINFNIDGKIIADKRIQLHFKDLHATPSLQVYLNSLKIGEFAHVINFFSPDNISKKIYQHIKPRGELNDIKALVDFKNLKMPIDITNYRVSLGIKNFGLNSFHSLPKIRNLSARVVLNKDRGRAYLESQDLTVYLKSLFRDPWPVDTLTGEIYWQKIQDSWVLGAKSIELENLHLKAQADLKLWFQNSGSMLMDLSGYYHDANVKYTSYYLPAHIMNQGLVEWLDNAIVSGWGTDGGVVFRGELEQFPFKDASGIMDIVFNTQDVELNYTPNWPELKNISAQVQFTEQGMWIDSDHSQIFSSVSDNIKASIEHYDDSVLRLNGDIKSTIKDGISFLKQSRLASEDVTKILDARGNIDINLNLVIPTRKGTPDSKVSIKLNNVDYFPPGFKREEHLVKQLSGQVVVHNKDINSKKLTAKIMGYPAKVAIKSSLSTRTRNASPDVNVVIDTLVAVKQFKKLKMIPETLRPVTDYISGQTRVNVDIKLPNEHRPFAVSVASKLVGLESKLPYPFTKTASKAQNLHIAFTDSKYSNIRFAYADIISLAMLLNSKTDSVEIIKGSLNFGPKRALLPKNKVVKLSGKIPLLPYEQWQAVLQPLTGKKSRKSSKPPIPVELALTELVLPKPELNQAGSTSESETANNSSSPQDFPLINGYIASIKLGSTSMGSFNIKTSRLEQSIIFDAITINGDILSFTGKGKWHQWNNTPEVDIEGSLKISSFEDFLNMAGYDQLMRGGKATISGYIGWPGDLSSYSKKTLEGKLSIEVEKGAYLEGKPGAAGRVLGLLNMNALARRISLDFSDVSDKGFEFEAIKGDFRITRGNAYTDNLRVLAPSAKILVTGRVGLVAEDYDEKVVVVPEISATLPIAGAAVAGPAGAAVVWVGQKLLGSQLNKITAISYTVKGSWYDPVIEKDKLSGNALENLKNLFGIDGSDKNLSDNNKQAEKP